MTPAEIVALPPLPDGAGEVCRWKSWAVSRDRAGCLVAWLWTGQRWKEAVDHGEESVVFMWWGEHERAVAQAERALREATCERCHGTGDVYDEGFGARVPCRGCPVLAARDALCALGREP